MRVWRFVMIVAWTIAAAETRATAQAPDPRATCLPTAPAHVLTQADAVLPELARRQGISGNVGVSVSLDANGAERRAAVGASPSTILDAAALAAVRASTFAPQIRGCIPVAGSVTVVVKFAAAAAGGTLPSIAPFFTGSWQCRTGRGLNGIVSAGLDRAGSTILLLASAYVSDTTVDSVMQRYSEQSGTLTMTTENTQFAPRSFVETSRGWSDNRLVFEGTAVASSRLDPAFSLTTEATRERMTFVRAGNDRFTRTYESSASPYAPWIAGTTETCVRISAGKTH